MDIDSTKTNSTAPSRLSCLLDFPLELLLAVLSDVLVQPHAICLHPHTTGQDNTTMIKPNDAPTQSHSKPTEAPWQILLNPPPITRTNRFLRNEGLQLFYEQNVFHALNWTTPRPCEWLRFIPADMRRAAVAKGTFLLSSGWDVEDVATYLMSKANGEFLGGVQVEAASKHIIGRLGSCEEAKTGGVFVVRISNR